jgi:single-stranded-DNA-specific exonuclease
MAARWFCREPDPAAEQRLSHELKLHPLAARVLAARGFTEPAAARAFLDPVLDGLNAPGALAGMSHAVARLREAITAGEKILVFGDYDVDGTLAIVILVKAIEMAGGAAVPYVPHRLREGYGMRLDAVASAAAAGFKLIVSVDTGIRAAEAVRQARELGLDVIVTDHHLPGEELPPAVAVLNPNRPDCTYPNKNLCGAGVALQLARALLSTLGWTQRRLDNVFASFLKMAAIATVADVVPLTGENRILVRHGLAGLADVRNPGLQALLEVSGIKAGAAPEASEVAFQIAPRINAAGRMDSADRVIELFLTPDASRARAIAEELDAINKERRRAEQEILNQVLRGLENASPAALPPALIFSGEGWRRGVLGIVAGRIAERFHRPCFVLGAESGVATGSGRSIENFHLLEALESMPDLFQRFGGHKQAAGVTLDASRIPEFGERLRTYAAARLAPEDLLPVLRLDAEARLEEFHESSVEALDSLAPFGFGNPRPLFCIRGVELAGAPAPFRENDLKLTLRQGRTSASAIAWGLAARKNELAAGARIDAAISVEPDEFSRTRGWPAWKATLRDWRPSS